jgi:hypothetical protein
VFLKRKFPHLPKQVLSQRAFGPAIRSVWLRRSWLKAR